MMTETESLQWMKWIENKRDKQKRERQQKEIIETQENVQQGPTATQKILRSIRTPDRRKRLGGNIY